VLPLGGPTLTRKVRERGKEGGRDEVIRLSHPGNLHHNIVTM